MDKVRVVCKYINRGVHIHTYHPLSSLGLGLGF